MALGIPKEQIAFIHDADNDIKKARLFEAVRSGKVRVLLGSTGKMGVGTNVQTLLIAEHEIDPRAHQDHGGAEAQHGDLWRWHLCQNKAPTAFLLRGR
jgi:hypothetical protein